jgi:methenyltetrahydromethanopterin cyclohydrolase
MMLNERALRIVEELIAHAADFRVGVETTSAGARIVDCGVKAQGGLQAGLALARVCLAGLAEVSLVPGDLAGVGCPSIVVSSDAPIAACMASQYAGWQVSVDKFFAMGSGPMRAAYGKEALFADIGLREKPPVAVGALESRKFPTDAVIEYIAKAVELPASQIALCVAPAASMAGTIQVVARSLETSLHKLHELKFDLNKIISGFGSAPLPPIAGNELEAIGRTNDAILYGGRVTLWVKATDDEILAVGPRVPSSASPDFGSPFAAIFERYNRDFYKIDPMLFSPAEIIFCNLKTGRAFTFGRTRPDVMMTSFFGEPRK